MATNMDKASNSSKMETGTKAPIPTGNLKVKELMLGTMDLFTKESSRMDSDSASESGNTVQKGMKAPT